MLCNILNEMGMPDHITCLLRNLYAGQEATVLTDCGTIDWFKIEKGVHHDCVQSPHRPEEFILQRILICFLAGPK